MSEQADDDDSPPEFSEILPLPRGEILDLRLFEIALRVAALEQVLLPYDYIRIPSLHDMIEATRKVAIQAGYGDEAE